MRPVFVAWLVRHGWPAWFSPDYATMVGLSTLIATTLALRQAKRDGARVHVQARAIMCAYVAALLGGYLFEWIRAIPVAVSSRSFAPIVFAGRAAYGGLVFGALAAVVYLRRRGETFLDFLDRATLGMGLVFACVRFGCFLEGCDFGRPTASVLGVRFPAGSLAAEAHRHLGWVPADAPSLPVHPTELYESGVGIVATLLALVPLRRGRRDGAAFATWLVVYAVGRFCLEQLRGDVERGQYGAFSTAQWVSVAILAGVLGVALRKRQLDRSASAATMAMTTALVLVSLTRDARADEPLPAAEAPPPTTTPPTVIQPPDIQPTATQPTTEPPVVAPPPTPNERASDATEPRRVVTLRAALVTSQTLARPDVPSGWAAELDALYRLELGTRTRLDLGLEGRRFENAEAIHLSLGVVGELVFVLAKHFEMVLTLVPHHTWFDFKSDFFTNTNAYGLRYAFGVQFPIRRVVLGVTPLAFASTSSTTVGVISQWEPRLWAGMSF